MDAMAEPMSSDVLRSQLVGSELYSVVFVRDYVQLYLDAEPGQPVREGWQATVNLYIDPVVEAESRVLTSTNLEWANALRSLINSRVVDVAVAEGKDFAVTFHSGVCYAFRSALRTISATRRSKSRGVNTGGSGEGALGTKILAPG
jgi:hypothetical protein